MGLGRARVSQKARFHRLILEMNGEASGFDFSVAFNTFKDFLSSPPRAALPTSSSVRRIFNDTRAVPLHNVPRVVVRLGGSRQAAQPPRKPPFCRLRPSIPISNGKPIVSSEFRHPRRAMQPHSPSSSTPRVQNRSRIIVGPSGRVAG